MKKIILFILVCFLLCSYDCKALNKEQQDNIATYAKELIEKGNLRIAKDGTPLLKYESGTNRLAAFKDELNKGHFVFNCDSFVSYVLYHTYGFKVIKSDNTPYTVTNYEQAPRRSNSGMYEVARGSYDSIKNKLEKGDIVVCFSKGDSVHVFLYVGDGLIAQARYAGLKVETFESYQEHYGTYMIIRLKEDAATKEVDMSIIWPDTKERDILGKDDYPTVNVSYDGKKYYKEFTMAINMSDDIMIDSYSINYNNESSKWISVSNKKKSVNYVVNKNGTYYILVKDSKGQIKKHQVNINNIDNIKPEIIDIKYIYNGNNTYNIVVEARDDTKLKYSIDGNNYQESNVIENIKFNNYILRVTDEVLNEAEYKINLSKDSIPFFKLSHDNENNSIILDISSDLNTIKKYAIQEEFNDNVSWLDFNDKTVYPVNKKGIYYIWLMNSDKVPYYEKINISDICDVTNISHKYEILEEFKSSFNIKINSDSKCRLFYSKDNINYQDSSVIKDVSYGENTIYIKDASNNVYHLLINHSKKVDINSIILITGIFIVAIILLYILGMYYKTRKGKARA